MSWYIDFDASRKRGEDGFADTIARFDGKHQLQLFVMFTTFSSEFFVYLLLLASSLVQVQISL